jgi:peptidoglycan hydrolase CwlO-like protein
MTTVEIIQLFIGSGGLIGIVFLFFRMGKFAQKVENLENSVIEFKGQVKSAFLDTSDQIDKKFDELDKRFDKIETDIKELDHSLTNIKVQIGKLETRVEERTLRVVQPDYDRTPAVR